MGKRRERVAPPPRSERVGFPLRGQRGRGRLGQGLCRAPENARTAWDRITTDPRQRDARQHPLRGTLGARVISGTSQEQWPYEVTGAGRLWCCIDDERRTVPSTPTFHAARVITVRLVLPFPAAVTTGIRSTIGQRR
jgi:hypothetical protein